MNPPREVGEAECGWWVLHNLGGLTYKKELEVHRLGSVRVCDREAVAGKC